MSNAHAYASVYSSFHFGLLPPLLAVSKGFKSAHVIYLCSPLFFHFSYIEHAQDKAHQDNDRKK